MDDHDDPLDLNGDGEFGAFEMCILDEEEERKKKGSGKKKSGCCVAFLFIGVSIFTAWITIKIIT